MTQPRDPDFLGWAPDEPLHWVPEVSISSFDVPPTPRSPVPGRAPAAAPASARGGVAPVQRPAPAPGYRPAPAPANQPVPAPGYPAVPAPGYPPVPAPGYPPPVSPAARVAATPRRPASPLRGPTVVAFLIALAFTVILFFAPEEAGGSWSAVMVGATITIVFGRLAWGMRRR